MTWNTFLSLTRAEATRKRVMENNHTEVQYDRLKDSNLVSVTDPKTQGPFLKRKTDAQSEAES